MKLFNRNKSKPQTAAVLNAARYNHSFLNCSNASENYLYDSIRNNVPIIDAAICKIVRLTGGYKMICSDETMQTELDCFANDIPVNTAGCSIYSFTDTFLDSLITYGSAVGEIVLDNDIMRVAGLFNGNINDIEIVPDGSFSKRSYFVRKPNGDKIPVSNPERILFSSINNRSGQIYGTSVLKGLPAISSILLRIYDCIGQNYERAGNIRYAVTYNPGNDPADKAFAKERAEKIAEQWSNGMNAAKNGETRDFIAVGDVNIKVIGADNQLFDTDVPVRQLLEQIVSKLSIPPFLLGLNWTSTERMSAQQADILTSELEYYRRCLNPVIKQIGTSFLRTCGSNADVSVEWDNINLQDETALADSRLKNAQAMEIEQRINQNL